MSFEAMAWAWSQTELSAAEKLVLMGLANYADRHNTTAYPSIKTLAKDCCQSERTAQRCLLSLREKGLIDWENRHRNDGSQTSSLYRLNVNMALPTVKLSPPPDTGSPPPLTQDHPPLTQDHRGGVTGSPHEPVIEPVRDPVNDPVTEVGGAIMPKPAKAKKWANTPIDGEFLDEMRDLYPAIDVANEYDKFELDIQAHGRQPRNPRAAFALWLKRTSEGFGAPHNGGNRSPPTQPESSDRFLSGRYGHLIHAGQHEHCEICRTT